MPRTNKPRSGSLQYWPRKRAERFLPSVNWKALEISNKDAKLLGFIGYKVGMISCLVKDRTPDSLTKDKEIPLPCTVIELPPLKILSARFYRNGKVICDVLADNLDKELKRILKLPKVKHKKIEDVKDFDEVRIIAYSIVKQTGLKKTPDLVEIGLTGTLDEKLNFVKEKIGKEILGSEILKPMQLIDIRGLTKGKGLVGPVKRFGIALKNHKSEKGVRRPGSLGPWHPHVVTYKIPLAGQMGLFTRIHLNNKVITLGKIKDNNINPKSGWKHYGDIKTEYAIIRGSVPGCEKRQLLLTFPLRKTKIQDKKKYEFVRIIR